jgi:hypothetical protein
MPNQQHSKTRKIIYRQKQIYTTKSIKTTSKTNKQTDKMFVHTPKLK